MRSVLQYLFLLAAFSFSALANPTPTDPEILIDIGFGSDSLQNQFNLLQPDGTNPSISLVFKNDTGGIVTSLTFDAFIQAHLTDTQVHSGFSCQPDAGNHFALFLSCGVDYTASTGELKYQFFGVNPADGDENFPVDHDNEIGQWEGVPIGGDFTLTLMNWTTSAAAGDGTPLFDGAPQLNNTFTATPEPSQLLLLAVASLLLVSIAAITRRRAKRKENNTTA
jgi:hypothetical protein